MQGELLVLRLVHVLGGIFWVGSALFMAIFLFPALASADLLAYHYRFRGSPDDHARPDAPAS